MGLDLLPESNTTSPSFSCPNSKPPPKSHLNQTRCFYDDDIKVGARSLPETPRMEYHRLSLQINKENSNNTNDEFKSPRSRFRQQQQQQDENRSPGHYAKQILKLVKESVSRRVGLVDITNTNRDEIRRDQNLIIKLSKKNSNDTKQSSPKLRISDTNKSPRNSTSSDTNPPPPSKPKPNKGNRVKIGPKTSHQAIRNKKEEPFVRSPAAKKKNKSKKAPLSSELIHLSGPTIVPVKKGPSPPATKLPQKQVFKALCFLSPFFMAFLFISAAFFLERLYLPIKYNTPTQFQAPIYMLNHKIVINHSFSGQKGHLLVYSLYVFTR